MKKKALNLTFHPHILDWADRLMALHGYSSISTMVEELIRQKYDAMCGPVTFDKDPTSLESKRILDVAKKLAEERDKKRGKRGDGDRARSSQTGSQG